MENIWGRVFVYNKNIIDLINNKGIKMDYSMGYYYGEDNEIVVEYNDKKENNEYEIVFNMFGGIIGCIKNDMDILNGKEEEIKEIIERSKKLLKKLKII